MVPQKLLFGGGALVVSVVAFLAQDGVGLKGQERDDSIRIEMQGVLRVNRDAKGDEPRMVISSKGITWEIDLANRPELRETAEKLSGKTVIVIGNLEVRPDKGGSERRVIAVTDLRPFPIGVGGEVHGFVQATAVREQERKSQIFLPDITVYVKNTTTGAMSPKVQSNIDGSFVIPHQPAGTYQICWEAPGYVAACSPEKIIIGSLTAFPLPVRVVPQPGLIVGRATNKNNGRVHFQDPFFGVDVQTKVRLVDNSGNDITVPVRANNVGLFVLTKVPPGKFRVIAETEGARVERTVAASAAVFVELVLPNSPPQIKTLFASVAGKGVRRIGPGTNVDVTVDAEDPDGDPLDYNWGPSAADGAFISNNAPTVQWTLPKSKGLHSMYLLVRDRRGGYAVGKMDLSTEDEGVLFTGTVTATDAPFVNGASIRINGTAAQTNAQGYFSVMLPKESNRYVLTIQKPGYELLSKVSQEGVIGGKYRLHTAQRFTIDPAEKIDVIERPKNDKRHGAQIIIEADSLVDEKGNRPTGLLDVFVSTIDQRDPDGRFPGDYGAVNAAGDDVTLTSFGAVDVQIQDATGNPFNLAADKTAVVKIPVDPAQLLNPGGPPATIPLWFYDPDTGMWKEEGKADLVGNFYEGKVKHFSVLNVDVAKVDASCMRLLVDQTRLRLPFNLRITIPTGTGVDKVVKRTVADPLSVIVRLPATTPITLEPLDSVDNPIPLAKQVVNSGAPIPGAADPNPPYPYANCTSEAILSLAVPSDGGFLNYPTVGTNNDAEATAYYNAIDPNTVNDPPNAKDTFAKWKTANGFDSGDEASAVYFNAGDLGFGRSMHMKKVGGDVAYYVSNYPTVDEARLNINLIATVAMEYSPVPPGTTRFTKFYVFDGTGARVNSADLDGRGPKFVPKLCIICHGGNYGSPAFPNMGSRFIPFDNESFEYSNFEFPPFLGTFPFSRAAQEPGFKTLNARVLDTGPTPAVLELVQGWYGGAGLPSSTLLDTFVPTGWINPVDKSSLYSQVVKTSCRACHTTRDAPIDWAKWDAPDLFDGFKEYGVIIKPLVCSSREMPQARRTFLNFWLSTTPHRPAALGAGGLDGWLPTDPCPEGP